MYSYLIYIGISHFNQLSKIQPKLLAQLSEKLDRMAKDFGGRITREREYHFSPSLDEPARKVAEAAVAMHAYLLEKKKTLYGITVLISSQGGEAKGQLSPALENLLRQVPDDDGLWVDSKILSDFHIYFEGYNKGRLFQVRHYKEIGPRLEDRLRTLFRRPSYLRSIQRNLDFLEKKTSDNAILLLRGPFGMGKRICLETALQQFYPGEKTTTMTLPFSSDAKDPLELFLRALGPELSTVADYLDKGDKIWWETEGFPFIINYRKGNFWRTWHDQTLHDVLEGFALYLKAHVAQASAQGKIAYLVVDGFDPKAEVVPLLYSLLKRFLDHPHFRLIIIWDSDHLEPSPPFPRECREVIFSLSSKREWINFIKEVSVRFISNSKEMAALTTNFSSNIYHFFHAILVKERDLDTKIAPRKALIKSFDKDTRLLLFLVGATAGLVDRSMITSRFEEDKDAILREETRYDGLINLGLIREDPDGRVRPLAGGPVLIDHPSQLQRQEAEKFGSFLYTAWIEGKSIDLFRFFLYMKIWGAEDCTIAVFEQLLENLLTNRRLAMAKFLLKKPLHFSSKLSAHNKEALRNITKTMKLRYALISNDTKQESSLMQDANIPNFNAQGIYSDHYNLQAARYSYVASRLDEALVSTKKALFSFQKAVNHEGETHSHVELALIFLAKGKIHDALEHFGIAQRIGSQVNASWTVLRAAGLEILTHYLFGDLPRAVEEGKRNREFARQEGRRDVWLLLTLVMLRINYDLGCYSEASKLAEEGYRLAQFYDLSKEARVMNSWHGRSLIAGGSKKEGMRVLMENPQGRESYAFCAEGAYFSGEITEAERFIKLAIKEEKNPRSLQGEKDNWTDGFSPIEGRLIDSHGFLDVLDEWIQAFSAFLSAGNNSKESLKELKKLLEKGDGRRTVRPFNCYYALWAGLLTSSSEHEKKTRFMGQAFNELQMRASHFSDNQAKHAWLTKNPWNKQIMREAQQRKFI